MKTHSPLIEERVPAMFTIRQVTKILNLSKSKIHLLIREGSLESVLIGRSRRITEGQLVRFIHLLEEQS